jgi:hypothetical protein
MSIPQLYTPGGVHIGRVFLRDGTEVQRLFTRNGIEIFSKAVADPYWTSVGFLMEGTAQDKTANNRAFTATGGAAFSGGAAVNLTNSKYFTVAQGALMAVPSGGDFTVEFNARDDAPNATWYSVVISAINGDNACLTGFIDSGESGSRRGMMIDTSNWGYWWQTNMIGGISSYHEHCCERYNGIMRWYVDGMLAWTSGSPLNDALSFNPSGMMIGKGFAFSDDSSMVSVKRVRITPGVARYKGLNYVPPATYPVG